MGNLRNENVTLHLNISSKKEKLSGIKAIYLVQPREETIKILTEDVAKDLYDNIYINFSHPIENSLLESFAASVARSNSLYKIKQVYQHHINFVSLNSNLFTLNIENIYSDLHCKKVEQTVKNSHFDYISLSLFSLFRTLKTIPVVMSQPGHSITSELFKRLEVSFFPYYERICEKERKKNN